MTDATILATVNALHRARQAWAWCSGHLVPGPIDRRRTVRLSPAALAARSQLHHQERAERVGNEQVGASPAPIHVGAIDARTEALDLAIAAAWTVTDALRRRHPFIATSAGLVRGYGPDWILQQLDQAPEDRRWHGATGYLLVAVRHVDPRLAGQLCRDIDTADEILRRTVGVTPMREAVPADCPVCGLPMLRVEGSAPDQADWLVRCENRLCKCRGADCACRIAGRVADRYHSWPAWDFARLHTPTRLGWLLRRADRKSTQNSPK